ncbi:MAG TPA: ice-binding family protein [Candidatus Nanopelagicaceae bacterium]
MKKTNKVKVFTAVALLPLLAIFISPASSNAATPTITQGTTTTYGVLAATTITNTGPTTISGTAGGDIGLAPGTSFTGNTTVTASGVQHIADTSATTAQTDLVTAFNDISAPAPTVLASPELASQVITPGVYSTGAGSFANSGALTLDAKGDANAVFIFQAATTLTTSAGSTMTLINGAQACHVYWKVGSSATLGANSTFVGHVYALTSITANTGANIQGQLLARTGAVNLNANTITNSACATVTPTPTVTPTDTATVTPTVTPTPVVTPVAPGTLIVIKHVVNTYGGTAVASDFIIHVTHNGSEVAGSPAAGVDGAGHSYTLAPGTYLVSETHVDGYYGTFANTDPALGGLITADGLITIASGQVATIVRTNYEVAPAYVPVPGPTANPAPATPPTPVTQTGGKLPKTGSPWFNLLALAAGLVLLGGVGLGTKKALR